MTVTVIQIIREGLQARGFDGLYLPDAQCGCLCDDLAPCGESPTGCSPGYRHDDPKGIADWVVGRSKEPLSDEAWEQIRRDFA